MGIFSSTLNHKMSPQAAQLVKDLIKSDVVVIFSKSYCPYCKLAKEVSSAYENITLILRFRNQVFDKIDKNYTAIELDNRDDASDIQDVLEELTGARTVSFLFIFDRVD